VSRGFSKHEVFDLTVRQVLFLTTVNKRLRDFETLQQIQTLAAGNGRQMDEMAFTSMTNKLRYG
jgi:hypothetical protein